MQNIDPVYFLQPIISIAFTVGIVIYWHYRRTFTRAALVYSFPAYAGAIAFKTIFQSATYQSILPQLDGNVAALGAYFALQTIFFEVGLAFLVAKWAVSHDKLRLSDAEGYGLGLALWENAGLIGVLGLLSLLAVYLTLAAGGSGAASLSGLVNYRPDLFFPPSQALPLIGWSLLERVTSLLFHVCWGYLTLLAAVRRSLRFLLLALPMGGVDFFVPFVNILGTNAFELFLFLLSLGAVGLTVLVTKGKSKKRRRKRLMRRVVR